MRAHLRFVSRIGHSHAVSMCAWPTATVRCALAARRQRERGREHLPARRPRCRRRRRGRGRRRPARASRSRRARRGSSRAARASARRARRRRARGRRPCVVDDGQVGLAQAVERRSPARCRASRAATDGSSGTHGFDGRLDARPQRPRRPGIRQRHRGRVAGGRPAAGRRRSTPVPRPGSRRRSGRKPRSITASSRGPAQVVGHVGGEPEPGRAPRAAPRAAEPERRERRRHRLRRTGPARRARTTPRW